MWFKFVEPIYPTSTKLTPPQISPAVAQSFIYSIGVIALCWLSLMNQAFTSATCSDPTPPNGRASPSPTNGRYTVGSFVIISCNNGYTLDGNSYRTCQAGGTWSGYATCRGNNVASQDFPIETVYKAVMTFSWVLYDFLNVTFSYFLCCYYNLRHIKISRLQKDY